MRSIFGLFLSFGFALGVVSTGTPAWGQSPAPCKDRLAQCLAVASIPAYGEREGGYEERLDRNLVLRIRKAAGTLDALRLKERAELIAAYAQGYAKTVDDPLVSSVVTLPGPATVDVINMRINGFPRQVALGFIEVKTPGGKDYRVVLAAWQSNPDFSGQAERTLRDALKRLAPPS